MYFIEEMFGASPDGGSGALELILLVIPMVLAGLVYARRLHWGVFFKRSGSPDHPPR